MSARSRDRRVYLRSHPVLFALLAATRGRGVRRLGGTVLVHDRDAYVEALTRIPLDRTAEGTTGGAAGLFTDGEVLFDQQGDEHRRARRGIGDSLGSAGIDRLRPVWTSLIERRLAPLATGAQIDLVPVAAELAGATAVALLGLDADPVERATAARQAAATTARAHLPGPRRRVGARQAVEAAARLTALIAPEPSLAAIIAVAAITTTVAALPRAAAWTADQDLWAYADRPALVDELLRVTAPTPLLPRVAAAAGSVGGCPVHAGDRMVLVSRHAVDAHRTGPDPVTPAPAQVARLVFGTGPHACPGARLARTQLADLLAALAPYRPRVVRARADRHAALPSWRSLVIEATTCG
jgi:cytochrome P450